MAVTLLVSCVFENVAAQAPALGSLQVTGEATVNGLRAAGEQTIFVGDTVRTGVSGRAALMMPTGSLTLGPETEVVFENASLLGTLRMGTVEVRTLQGGKSLEIQFGGQITYLPYFEAQSAGTVTVGSDRSARIECRVGSISLTANQGSGVVSLGPGQWATIAPDGKLAGMGPGTVAVTPAPQGSAAAKPAAKEKSRKGYVILGVGAGAGVGIGVALAATHKGQPVSPTSP